MSQGVIAVATIVAIIAGPLFTLLLQKWTEARREKRQQRMWVFRVLMMYRANPIDHNYVQALNLIDVVFDEETDEERAIRNAWKELLDHLQSDQASKVAQEKAQDLGAVLLMAMGKRLGYRLDAVYLKRQAYQPQGHVDIARESNELRRLALDFLKYKQRLPVAVFADDFEELRLPPDAPTTVAARATTD
jgi:Family of unknown function (DUF6680)